MEHSKHNMFSYLSTNINNYTVLAAYRHCLEKYYRLKKEFKELKKRNKYMEKELKELRYKLVNNMDSSSSNDSETDNTSTTTFEIV